jgi:hypothetical protein
MNAPTESEMIIDAPAKPSALRFAFALTTACPICAFALWTITSHVAVAAHLSFHTLTRVGPFAVMAGIGCGVFATIRRPRYGLDAHHRTTSQGPSWKWLTIAAAIVALRALGIGYSAFWILAVVFLASIAAKSLDSALPDDMPARIGRTGITVMLLLAVLSAALTYTAHRPDSDDANFVGFAADAVAHPELPVLSHDVLYGGNKLPLILPTYAVSSYELFAALLATLLGGEPIWWMHAVLPTILGAFLPFAWAELMRILAPRHWIIATALTLVLLALLGEAHYSLGNFAFVRLFQGKAVLASIGIPLLYAFAWKFQDTGSVWDWLLLACCTVACVGLSAAALFVAPMALGIAALAGWRKAFTRRAALAMLPAVYPLAWGLALRGTFKAVAGVFAAVHRTAPATVAQLFGAHGQYVLLLALLCAPFLVHEAPLRRKAAVAALLYFLVPLDSFLFKFLARLTTAESVWRVLWSLPVIAIAATAIANAVERADEAWGKRGKILAALLVLGCFASLLRFSSLRTSNGVVFSFSPLKVPARDWETARAAISATPPSTTLLAPEAVAAWVPTFVHRPPLVSVRQIYDDQMGIRMSPEEAKTRRELRELVSGRAFTEPQTQQLLDELPHYRVGLVVARSSVASKLRQALTQHNFISGAEKNSYVFFSYNGNSELTR